MIFINAKAQNNVNTKHENLPLPFLLNKVITSALSTFIRMLVYDSHGFLLAPGSVMFLLQSVPFTVLVAEK